MSIEITSQGPARFSVCCPRCGTQFTYELGDLMKRYGETWNRVRCPREGCGEEIQHPLQSGVR